MIPIRQYWLLLRRYLRRQRVRVTVLAVVLLAGITLQVALPQIIKVFIDRALGGAAVDALVPIATLFLVFAVAQQAFAVSATWIAEHVGWTATNDLRRDLTDHLLHLDMGFHKEHTPGEMVERIDGDVTALSNFFAQFAVQVIGNAFLLLGVLALLTRESVIVGGGMIVLSAASLGVMTRMQRVASAWWARVKAHRAEYFGFLGETTGATEDIRANGATEFVEERSRSIMRGWLPDEVLGRHGWSILWGANIVFYAIGNTLVFAVGSWLLDDGTLTLGAVYLIFHYTEMLRHPLDRIRTQMEDLQKAGAGIVRVQDLMRRTTALPAEGRRHLPQGSLSVELDGVDFSYRDENGNNGSRVLHDVSVRFEAGRIIGVLGRTGSGKTTLARLLTRLYDPDAGGLLIGGVAAHEIALSELRKRVGMVTQDVQLFRAAIRDNLTFFDDTIEDTRVVEALAELGLDDWVAAQPEGIKTVIDARSLSTGEAQLLAFTRIFLEDSGLVVLDEASSRVDPVTEQLIERALDRLLAGRTGIIIAHRLATVQRADDILVLEEGRVVEFGPRAALAADPSSRFSRLLRTGMKEVLA